MKKKIIMAGITMLMIGFVACKSPSKATSSSANTVVAKNLVDKYWKLTEIYGVPVASAENGNEAHMIFNAEENRVYGNSGCNTFSGTYDVKQGNQLSFSEMISTRKMCFNNMDIETKMNQIFQAADSYEVNENILLLYKSQKELLARFTMESLK